MLDENTLFIIGAGASKSLGDEIQDKDNHISYRDMPTGWDLVQRVSEYRLKALSRFISYTLYQIYSGYLKQTQNLTDFTWYSEIIEKSLKTFYKAQGSSDSIKDDIYKLSKHKCSNKSESEEVVNFFISKFKESRKNTDFFGDLTVLLNWLSYLILINHNPSYAKDNPIKKNISDTYNHISKINDRIILGNISDLLLFSRATYYENGTVTNRQIFSSICLGFTEIVSQSKKILIEHGKDSSFVLISRDLSFITQKLCDSQNAKMIEFLTKLNNRTISISDVKKVVGKLFNPLVEKSQNNACHKRLQDILLLLDVTEKEESFIKKYISFDNEQRDVNTAINKINKIKEIYDYVVNSYIVGHMMSIYSPSSIDDFVMNFESYTGYSSIHKQNDCDLPDVETLKHYTRYLMSCVILEDSYSAKIFGYGSDNYIKFISRLIISGCEDNKKKLDKSLKELSCINFNYDTTLFSFLIEYLPTLAVSDYYNNNVIHPYGRLIYEVVKNKEENTEKRLDNLRQSIWDNFFQKNDFQYIIGEEIVNVFEQSLKIVDLIREKTGSKYEKRSSDMCSKFLNAKVVCFCGFGFDKENLAFLGLVSKDSKKPISQIALKSKEKKIYIAKADSKILMTLEEVFGCKMKHYKSGVWRPEGRGNIVASENNLNYALNNDFLL